MPTNQAVTDAIYKGTPASDSAGTVALQALYVLQVTRLAPGWSDWRHRENYFVRYCCGGGVLCHK